MPSLPTGARPAPPRCPDHEAPGVGPGEAIITKRPDETSLPGAGQVYPPRLRDESVLLEAVRDGAGGFQWRDTFAYAELPAHHSSTGPSSCTDSGRSPSSSGCRDVARTMA